jgi:SMI1 / KNR4 family (SUKH-1)
MRQFVINGRVFNVILPGKEIDEATVFALEKRFGFAIPQQLRQFYLKYNGAGTFPADVDKRNGLWVRLLWDVKTQKNAAESSPAAPVGTPFEIDPSKYDLWAQWLTKKDYVPEGMLPFADDPGGDPYLIGVVQENLGKIFFWAKMYDYDYESGGRASPNAVALVANSFVEYLLAFRQEPNDGESGEDWVKRVYAD